MMCFPRWGKAVLIAVGVFCVGRGAPVQAQEQDGPDARDRVGEQSRAALLKEDFAWLEKTAREYRTSKSQFADGTWRLSAFYDGIKPNPGATAPSFWKSRMTLFEHWKAAYPASVTQHVAQAHAFLNYATNARQGGDTAEKAVERVQEARRLLEEAQSLPETCPTWYHAMQSVAISQGWPLAEYDALYQKAVQQEPTYYQYYFSKAFYLFQRGRGELPTWEQYAEEAVRKGAQGEGLGLYTRVAWANSGNVSNLFTDTGIEWPRMRQGFRDLEKRYPNSRWNLNSFASFAFQAGDRETTLELLARIGDQPYLRAWPPGKFELARRSAGTGAAVESRETLAVLPSPGPGIYANGIAFSPDGRHLAVAYGNGTADIWEVATAKPSWSLEGLPAPVSSVAWSPDGKLFAVGTGLGGGTGEGMVQVYDVATKTERITIGDWIGAVGNLAFTPDGRSLIMVGGRYQEKSQSRRWDVATGTVEPLGWEKEHTHHLEFLAVAPNSRLIAVECGQAINVWDLQAKTFAFSTKQYELKAWIWGLAFSPDGALLAAGAGPEFTERERSKAGRVLLWDVNGWREHQPAIRTPTGGLGPVAFSPNSRFLAGGGYEQCVRVWELATGREVATFLGHQKFIRAVAFSPDGKVLASSSGDGTVRLWKAPQ